MEWFFSIRSSHHHLVIEKPTVIVISSLIELRKKKTLCDAHDFNYYVHTDIDHCSAAWPSWPRVSERTAYTANIQREKHIYYTLSNADQMCII